MARVAAARRLGASTAAQGLDHRRHRRARGGHARLDRDPAALAAREGLALSDWLGARFTSNGDAIALAYNNDVPVNGVGVGNPPKAHVPPVGQAVNGLIDLRDDPDVRDGLAIVECALPSAFAPLLPALLAPGGALFGEHELRSVSDELDALGRADREPDQGRLSTAPCTTRRRSSPSATTRATA